MLRDALKLLSLPSRRRRIAGDTTVSVAGNQLVTDALRKYALLFLWALIILLFGILESATFLRLGTFQLILGSQAVLLILTLGVLIPLTAGDFDLSIAANLTLASMVVAILNVQNGVPIGWAVLAALAVGAVIGAGNGAAVVLLGIDSFIVTLGTGTLLLGVVFWISDSTTISGVSPVLVDLVFIRRLLGIPLAFYYGLVLCITLWYILEWTPVGRRLLFVGRGRNVSRLSGILVGRVRWGAFVASGMISALAGVVFVGTTGAADPSSGRAFLLPAFAAAFLGATTIRPGQFNPWGSLVAVYTLVTGITGLQLLGAKGFVQELFYGSALIVAVGAAQFSRRKEVRESGTLG